MDTTQPILCCVGESVVGKPTQFVMDRTLAATDLDWRTITVEVDLKDITEALAGIRAMKFRAVRFFESCQRHAIQALVPEDNVCKFVGAITSAARMGSQWSGWHSFGYGLVNYVHRCVDLSACTFWLHGNSTRTRSAFVALVSFDCHGVLWTDGPDEFPKELADQAAALSLNKGDSWPDTVSVEDAINRLSTPAGGSDSLAMLVDGPMVENFTGSLEDTLSERFDNVLLSGTRDWESVHQLPQAKRMPEVELAVSAEAYDFERWTSISPDLDLMREAYEEYCDFF
jgi:hypothetical protein